MEENMARQRGWICVEKVTGGDGGGKGLSGGDTQPSIRVYSRPVPHKRIYA
jgi:hypothetical protein